MNGFRGHGAPVMRSRRRVLPPSELRSCGLVPCAASPVPTSSAPPRVTMHPAAAVPAGAGGEAADQRVDPGGRGRRRVEVPGDDAYVVAAAAEEAALARVEATVGGEVGVDLEPHQAGLTRHPHLVAGELHPARHPVLPHREGRPVPLREQQPALPDRLHVPRVVEPGDLPAHDEPRHCPGLLASCPAAGWPAGGPPPRRPGRGWSGRRVARRTRCRCPASRPPARPERPGRPGTAGPGREHREESACSPPYDPTSPAGDPLAHLSLLVAGFAPTRQFWLPNRRRPVSSCRRDQISRDAHSPQTRSWVVLGARIDGYGADKRCFLVIEASGRELRVTRSLSAMAVGLVVPTLVLGGCSGDPEPKIAPSESSSPVASASSSATPRASIASSPAGPVHRQVLRRRSRPRSPPETLATIPGCRRPATARTARCSPRTSTAAYEDGGRIEGGSCRVVGDSST